MVGVFGDYGAIVFGVVGVVFSFFFGIVRGLFFEMVVNIVRVGEFVFVFVIFRIV